MANKITVGVDLGGTNVSVAVVDAQGHVLGEAKRRTKAERGADAVAERVADTVRRGLADAHVKPKKVQAIGVGVPGPLDPKTGVVARAVNLGPSWDNFAFGPALESALKIPVLLDNDVRVGAMGEYTYGAGRGTKSMLAIFVGTGVGGGFILDGKLWRGFRNSAGEVGHMILQADGMMCNCGNAGCAEPLTNRGSIERRIQERVDAGRPSIVPNLMRQEDRELMTSGVIARAFEAGDVATVEAVGEAQRYLGLLVATCVNFLDPEAVVIGGGVVEKLGDEYLTLVRQVAREHFVNRDGADKVRIVAASLGDYSGSIGAAVLAREVHRKIKR